MRAIRTATCPNQNKNEVDLEPNFTKCADLEQNETELEHQNNNYFFCITDLLQINSDLDR